MHCRDFLAWGKIDQTCLYQVCDKEGHLVLLYKLSTSYSSPYLPVHPWCFRTFEVLSTMFLWNYLTQVPSVVVQHLTSDLLAINRSLPVSALEALPSHSVYLIYKYIWYIYIYMAPTLLNKTICYSTFENNLFEKLLFIQMIYLAQNVHWICHYMNMIFYLKMYHCELINLFFIITCLRKTLLMFREDTNFSCSLIW